MRRNRLLDAGWFTNLQRFQEARPNNLRSFKSKIRVNWCFPTELVNFVGPGELLVSSGPRHVTRSPPITKRNRVGRYNKLPYLREELDSRDSRSKSGDKPLATAQSVLEERPVAKNINKAISHRNQDILDKTPYILKNIWEKVAFTCCLSYLFSMFQ